MTDNVDKPQQKKVEKRGRKKVDPQNRKCHKLGVAFSQNELEQLSSMLAAGEKMTLTKFVKTKLGLL